VLIFHSIAEYGIGRLSHSQPMPSPSPTSERSTQQQLAELASLRSVHEIFSWLHLQENELLKRQVEVAEIPAPPFDEMDRAIWLRKKFTDIGLEQVEIDEAGNVIGVLVGTDQQRGAVAITAHLDTVFPREIELTVRVERDRLIGPGVSDNAAGIIGMLALASGLRQSDIRCQSNVIFIGNVGEEGEGDLRGMRHIFETSPWKDSIAHTLVIDGSGTDAIITQALGSRRFEITVRGPGGHSWSDFGQPNPIVALSRAIARFSQTSLPPAPKATFNFGVISGGTSVNSIPEMAQVSVDLRSSSTRQLQQLEDELRRVLREEVSGAGSDPSAGKLTYEVRKIGDRPSGELSPTSRILEVARTVDAHLGIVSQVRRASTDANIPISMGRDALTLGAGGSGGGAHTIREWFEPAGRTLGLKRILLATLLLTGVE
jgi:acetylornithine deacetylase/succinyl-diaminopimelate desuccinylase-like protein